jgi:hypothetical protein
MELIISLISQILIRVTLEGCNVYAESLEGYVGIEIFTMVVMKNYVLFWHVTPCSPLKVN